MNNLSVKQKLVGFLTALLVLLGAGASGYSFGGGGGDFAYGTTTRTYNGGTLANLKVLKNSPGALGTLIITGAGAGQINFYDATSTRTNTEWGTTTLATIPLSAAAGTYIFDVAFSKGLIYEIIGTAPTSTITWR